jgi:hypothetical protein
MSSKKDVIKKSKGRKYEEWLIESWKDHALYNFFNCKKCVKMSKVMTFILGEKQI